VTVPGEDPQPAFELDDAFEPRHLLTAIVDSTSDLVWCVDAERFTLRFSNRALREYFRVGSQLELRAGMTQEELFPAGDLAECWKGFYRRALREGPYTMEYGTSMASLVLELHFALLEREGRVFGITVFGRDVTAQRRAVDRLRSSEAFFRNLQEASADVSAVIGGDGRFRFISSAVRNVLGYPAEELMAQPPFATTHPDDHARMMGALQRLLRSEGHVERQRYRIRHKDGSWRHLEAVGRNLGSNPDVAGVMINSRDVTEQVRLAARLQHVREEEKARIARDLHDELGQLLTGVQLDLLWLEERLEALPATPVVSSLVERAVAASELAEQTIGEVQRLATDLRPAALDRLGLDAALQQEGRRFQGRTGIPCTVDVTEALGDLPADAATALYRIFQEALTNVARHARASQVRVRLRAEAGAAVLTIEDDGMGIDPCDPDVSGSLGLAGMRERAALEGGELAVLPRAEGGTRVEARLPLSGAGAVAP